MDRRIRQVAALLTTLLIGVAISSGYVQGVASESIANRSGSNPNEPAINPFRVFQECRWQRGTILSIDGQELARSEPAPQGGKCTFQRVYPLGDLAAHAVGRWSLHFGKTGMEAAYNEDLVGKAAPAESFSDYFADRDRIGNNVYSTIDTRLQRAALDALAGRRGGVVALNPKNGAVLVAASNPSFDPNPLASNDRAVAKEALCRLGVGVAAGGEPCENPNAPLVSVALQGRRPPGSTFKVLTAAAALESGKFTPSTRVPSSASYTPPGSRNPVGNFGSGACGGSLTQILTISCNTGFARVAVDVGADQLASTAHAMGLDQFGGSGSLVLDGCDAGPISDIANTRTGCLPNKLEIQNSAGKVTRREKLSTPDFLARAGFGQWVLQVSPFGMAIVAGTVANGGYVPRPRFADRVIDQKGQVVREIRTGVGTAAISPDNAKQLAAMMRTVVTSGTASRAFSGFGVAAAGKTGTAQQPSCPSDEQKIFGPGCGRLPHAWFIAFAPVEDPSIAIAVLVERGGGNNEEATGGRVAAPVARKVLESYFQLYPQAAGRSGGNG